MDALHRRETLIVRRRGFRWALAAAYLSMLVILSVTLTGNNFVPTTLIARSK